MSKKKQLELRIIDGQDVPVVSSLEVAEVFGKEHKHVLRDIKNLNCSADFNRSNFGLVDYTDAKGEKRPMYYMTKDGFVLLAMGYKGKKAMQFKEAYIKRFNAMESALMKQRDKYISERARSKAQRRTFTDAIQESGENERMHGHGYKNLTDLVYKCVLGVPAKQARELLNVPDDANIRDYLPQDTLKAVIGLEHIATGLLDMGFTYAEIKARLALMQLTTQHYLA